jgi:trehalose transport system substrate-binding protein
VRKQSTAYLLSALFVALICTVTWLGADGALTGGGGGTTITFSIAVADQEKPAIQQLLARFEERERSGPSLDRVARFRDQPGIRVKLVTGLRGDDLVSRLREDRNRRDPGIQLFAQDNLALWPLVSEHLVQDVSDVTVPAEVTPSLRPPQFPQGTFFLPFRPNVRLGYASKECLTRAGVNDITSPEQLSEAAQQLKDVSWKTPERSPKVTLSLARGDPRVVTLSELVLYFGGNPVLLDDAGSIAAFKFVQRLWKERLIVDDASLLGKYDTEPRYLIEGTTCVAQNWSFTSSQLAERGVLPNFSVWAGWGRHVIGGDVLGIPSGVTGKERRAAVALADYLMSREAQELLVRQNTWPSIREDAYAAAPRGQAETFHAIAEALRDGWYRPQDVPYWPAVSDQMNEALDRVIRMEPVEQVLHELHDRVAESAREQGANYPPTWSDESMSRGRLG